MTLVGLAVANVAGASAPCPRAAPLPSPPAHAPSPPRPPTGPGEVTVELRTVDPDDRPVPLVPVQISAEGLPEPVWVTTDANGEAVVTGLPVPRLTFEAWRRVTLDGIRPGRTEMTLEVVGPPELPAADAEPLAPELVLTYERGGCLGPCPAFFIEVAGDGSVQRDGEPPRTSSARRLARIDALGRCARGLPVYDEPRFTDAPWVELVFRQDGSVWRWFWSTADPRAPARPLRAFQRRLERALGARAVNRPTGST